MKAVGDAEIMLNNLIYVLNGGEAIRAFRFNC
jgi:hypothetical protein